MHPILFSFGPICIFSYGFTMALAFAIALFLARRAAKAADIDPAVITDLALILLFSGVIGARLLYVFINIKDYILRPVEIIMLQHGGLSLFGGLLAGSISGVIYAKKKKLSVYRLGDLIIPYAALGQAIGRIGCFLNGCCFGKPTDSVFGVVFPGSMQAVYPTQIYSSLAMLFLYGILRLEQKMNLKEGLVLISYGIFYSLTRFFMEFYRGDDFISIFGFTFSQVVSIAAFAICSALFILRLKK